MVGLCSAYDRTRDWFPGSWPGLTMTSRALRLLQDLRCQLLHPPADKEVIDEAVTAAA